MLKEFKEFISKGNAVELAVGVIIGSAFSTIVNSLVNDIFMPIIGVITGGVDFTNLTLTYKDAVISYGNFIQNIVNFLIIAFCLFLVIKAMNKLNEKIENDKKKMLAKKGELPEEPKTEEVVPEDIKLLREIAKELKKSNKK